jgi:hypothetical protein
VREGIILVELVHAPAQRVAAFGRIDDSNKTLIAMLLSRCQHVTLPLGAAPLPKRHTGVL